MLEKLIELRRRPEKTCEWLVTLLGTSRCKDARPGRRRHRTSKTDASPVLPAKTKVLKSVWPWRRCYELPRVVVTQIWSLVSCDQYQSRAWSWTLFGILFVMHMATSHSIGFAKMINRTHARILASRNYSMLIQFQCNKMQCEFSVNFISFHCQFICNAMPIQFQFNTNSVKFINSLVPVKS